MVYVCLEKKETLAFLTLFCLLSWPHSLIIVCTIFITSIIFRSSLFWENTYLCLKRADIKALLWNQRSNIRQVYRNVLNSFPLPVNIRWYRRLVMLPLWFYSIAGMVHATPTYTTSIPTLIKYLSHTFLFFSSEVEINCKFPKL